MTKEKKLIKWEKRKNVYLEELALFFFEFFLDKDQFSNTIICWVEQRRL